MAEYEFTIEDLGSLDLELSELTSEEWMKREGVRFDVISEIVASAQDAMILKTLAGSSADQILAETIANSFVIGWESYKQFGPSRAKDGD